MPPLARELELLERADLSIFMKGAGPQTNASYARSARERARHLLRAGQPLDRLEPVHDLANRSGYAAASRGELAGEDHRPLVAVGVEEHDPAPSRRERRARDRHDRRDAAAAREEQQVGVERRRA